MFGTFDLMLKIGLHDKSGGFFVPGIDRLYGL